MPGPAARLPLIVVLAGPTGSGKSAWAEQLATALPLEIVSVDSAQIYRGMDIGTAKPSAATRARLPHHLIDLRDPAEPYSAGEFVRDALEAIHAIHARGRVPLLAGGTMLYFRALYRGMAALPSASPALRAALDARGAERGWPALHAELAAVDPLAAARIHPNDRQRIQRALEVFAATGQPISQIQEATRGVEAQFEWCRFALWPASRVALQSSLAARFADMLEQGLLGEVQRLYARGDLSARDASVRAVGYRQLWQHLSGELTLAEASQGAVYATTQLAKRQLTWLRREAGYTGLVAEDPQALVAMQELLRTQLAARGVF